MSLELIDADGHRHDLRHPLREGSRLGHPVLQTQPFAASSGSVLAVSYDNGFWLKIPGDAKETNTATLMVPRGTASHWTVKYSKALLGPGSFNHRVHSRLELSALADPFTLAVQDDRCLVQRLLQPLAGDNKCLFQDDYPGTRVTTL